MNFSIRIGQKLDLSKFRKQAACYIKNLENLDGELRYDIFVEKYKIAIAINKIIHNSCHSIQIKIYEIIYDRNNVVIGVGNIFPTMDARFQESEMIKSIFGTNAEAFLQSANVEESVDKICQVIKYVHKINKLKVFA